MGWVQRRQRKMKLLMAWVFSDIIFLSKGWVEWCFIKVGNEISCDKRCIISFEGRISKEEGSDDEASNEEKIEESKGEDSKELHEE